MERSRPKTVVFAAVLFALACESRSIGSPLDEGGGTSTRPVVASTRVTADSVNIGLGKIARLPATNASGTRIMWSSVDPYIARVDSTGLVSARAIGTVAVIGDIGGVKDTTFVSVVATEITSVSINAPSGMTIGVGESYPMSASTKDGAGTTLSDRVIEWSSDNPGVASVSATGNVIGIGTGTANITVSSEGLTDSRAIVVVPERAPVTSIGVLFGDVVMPAGQTPAITVGPWQVNGGAWSNTGAPISVKIGESIQAAAVGRGADGAVLVGRNVIWSSLTPSVATVTSSGLVTAVGNGTAMLRAVVETKTGDGIITIDVTPVATVSVTLAATSLTVGQSTQAVAVAREANGAVLTGRSVGWSSLNPNIATVSPTGMVTGVSAGTAMIRATVETKTGDASVTVASVVTTPATPPTSSPTDVAGDAELPRAYVATGVESTPSPGKTIRVASGEDLQSALDAAAPGDRVTLECGASFVGNFRLEAKGGSGGWITVQSECALPSPGTRTSPTQSFTKLVSPGILPVIFTLGPTARWRIVGVEMTTAADVEMNQGLVALGCSHICETQLDAQPSDIILDRVWIHGTPNVDVRRCVGLNGARLAVIDSYLSDCHSTFDAQAVGGWNGPGPFKITNNYLEGSAENIAFGGADPSIPGVIPSDIEIRHNHIIKPMSWKGGRWLIKNLIELKVGRRVLIDGNVIENSWPQGQAGFAFVLWSVNQQQTCPTCVTENLTIQNNEIRSVAAGFNLDAIGGYTAVPMNHVVIRNNVIIGLDNGAVGGNGRMFQISNIIPNLSIEHNTGFSPSNSSFIWAGNSPLPQHIVRNNLVGGGQYQLFTSWGQGQTAWDHVAGPGSVFAGNIVALFNGGTMPPGNYETDAFVWLALAGGPSAAYNPNATLDDLALSPSSGFAKKGTDGRDPGADIAAVKAATAGVVR